MSHQEFYDLWYATRKPQWDTDTSPPELLEFIRDRSPGRALDLGCGTGTNVVTLAQAGWKVMGVDFSPTAIAQARERVKKLGVSAQFRTADVMKVWFPMQSFDLVLDWGCFQGIGQKRRIYARRVMRWLVPGGWFLLYSLKHQPDMHGFGVQEEDIHLFSSLKLVCRVDGFNRGPVTRPSVWLEFRKETG